MALQQSKESEQRRKIFFIPSKYNFDNPMNHETVDFYDNNVMRFLRSLDLNKYIEFTTLWGTLVDKRIPVKKYNFRFKMINKTKNHRLYEGGNIEPSLVNCMLNYFGLLKKLNNMHGSIPSFVYKDNLRNAHEKNRKHRFFERNS